MSKDFKNVEIITIIYLNRNYEHFNIKLRRK